MSVRNQLSDYELGEFFRSLQDLLGLSLDANLSYLEKVKMQLAEVKLTKPKNNPC